MPVAAISHALWAPFELDPLTMTVCVANLLDGSVTQYVSTTGEGLSSHALSLGPCRPRDAEVIF